MYSVMAMIKQAVIDSLESSPLGLVTKSDLVAKLGCSETELDKALYSLESEMVVTVEGNMVMLCD